MILHDNSVIKMLHGCVIRKLLLLLLKYWGAGIRDNVPQSKYWGICPQVSVFRRDRRPGRDVFCSPSRRLSYTLMAPVCCE